MERFFTWKKRNKGQSQSQTHGQTGQLPPAQLAPAHNPIYTAAPAAPTTQPANPPPAAQPASAAPAVSTTGLNASNSLLSELLAIIDHSKNVSVIDSPKTQVYQDLAELKQTCEGARSVLQSLAKSMGILNSPKILETMNNTMQELRKVLLGLEKAVPDSFWHSTKVKVYQLDFLLKMQSDQIGQALTTSDISSLISVPDGKKWWSASFGDKVRRRFRFYFFRAAKFAVVCRCPLLVSFSDAFNCITFVGCIYSMVPIFH